MRVVRSRTLLAGAPAVWVVLADPYALPRWWPLARRVEGVSEAGWTVVLGREGARGVRADQRLEASEPRRLRRWAARTPRAPSRPSTTVQPASLTPSTRRANGHQRGSEYGSASTAHTAGAPARSVRERTTRITRRS